MQQSTDHVPDQATDLPSAETGRWLLMAMVSLVFFVTTGGTFSSLGVLLPAMVGELQWSWTEAGLGFTVLALFTGLSSTFPATIIKWFGIKAPYLAGGIMLASGFFILSITQSVTIYLCGAGLVGLGYSLTGAVPAVTILSSWFSEKRSLAIGVFFTFGALGSVCAPLIANYVLSADMSWRLYWQAMAVITGGLSLVLAVAAVLRAVPKPEPDNEAAMLEDESQNWTFGEVLRNYQYHVITLAVTITLLGTLTMNTWQVTHLQNLGVSATIAASALSMHALFNAASRIGGGLIIDRVGAKLMFCFGLVSGVIGMFALSIADSYPLILIFAIGDGICFGIVTFASSILLLEYFGARNNPMILGFQNLVTTLAMVGPVMAGGMADRIGGFTEVFMIASGLMFIVFLLSLTMKKPVRPSIRDAA